MKKWVKIVLIIFGVVLLAGFARLGIFLHNVNRDLDYLVYRTSILSNKVNYLELQQASTISNQELQRVLQRQADEYQNQLNGVYGQINAINDQNKRDWQDYQDQLLRERNNPFERR
jgi:uncharacterized protein YbaP (TraB family)